MYDLSTFSGSHTQINLSLTYGTTGLGKIFIHRLPEYFQKVEEEAESNNRNQNSPNLGRVFKSSPVYSCRYSFIVKVRTLFLPQTSTYRHYPCSKIRKPIERSNAESLRRRPICLPVARNKLNLNWLTQRTEESRPNEGAVVSAAIDRAK